MGDAEKGIHLDPHNVAENDRQRRCYPYEFRHVQPTTHCESVCPSAEPDEGRAAEESQECRGNYVSRIALSGFDTPNFRRVEIFPVKQFPHEQPICEGRSHAGRTNSQDESHHRSPPDAHSSPMRYSAGMNVMQTGAGTSSTWPVGVKAPVAASIRNTTMFPES